MQCIHYPPPLIQQATDNDKVAKPHHSNKTGRQSVPLLERKREDLHKPPTFDLFIRPPNVHAWLDVFTLRFVLLFLHTFFMDISGTMISNSNIEF